MPANNAGRIGSSGMRWLFAVFIASLCALLWAAISVARHIRRDRKQLPPEAAAATETEVEVEDNL
jgi:hypothetical protein